MTRTTPIPREHGAYVVVLTCWLLGVFAAHSIQSAPMLLSLVTVLAGFAAVEPLRLFLVGRRSGRATVDEGRRNLRWAAILFVVMIAAGIPLVLLRPAVLWLAPAGLIVFGVYFWMISRKASMSDLSFVGFAGLALAGPLARIASDPVWAPLELGALWLFVALFFCASAWCVRIRLVGRDGLVSATVAHVVLTASTIALVITGALPGIAIAAIVPAIVRFAWVSVDIPRYRRQPLKRIGIVETVIALGLVVAAVWF